MTLLWKMDILFGSPSFTTKGRSFTLTYSQYTCEKVSAKLLPLLLLLSLLTRFTIDLTTDFDLISTDLSTSVCITGTEESQNISLKRSKLFSLQNGIERISQTSEQIKELLSYLGTKAFVPRPDMQMVCCHRLQIVHCIDLVRFAHSLKHFLHGSFRLPTVVSKNTLFVKFWKGKHEFMHLLLQMNKSSSCFDNSKNLLSDIFRHKRWQSFWHTLQRKYSVSWQLS